ncbi:hypothetical protein AD947_12765 [Acetobacter tropicalis]|uniref:Formate hydrogenlyase subunit 4 n=1 Tax=Acetobacter tropicalis TaxID=104102 RepID=A0A149TS32_9PROT|nr:hypothetical protein [Acetobacter tropicalis]KXV55938.1 hypothetical protein AD947_12765 [Acetobacter tropicalis]
MTPTPSPLTLSWGWMFLSALSLVVQTGLMLFAAPFFRGWVERLAGRLAGQTRYLASGRWQEIRHQFVRPGFHEPGDNLSGLAARAAFVLAVLGAGLVPVYALVPSGFPAPGLLLVCGVLVGASLLLSLPRVVLRGQAALGGYMAFMADALLLPSLVPVLVMVGGQDLSAFLAHVRGLSPLGAGAPFVLMGVALFGAAAWRGTSVGAAQACPLSGADRGVWLLAEDIVQLCWVTLAGDVAWAGCLALPTDGGVEPWLMACLQGGGAWLLKLVIAALLLAGMQLMVLPPARRARVRLACVFLLGLLAWQAAYPGLATPTAQDKTAAIQVQDPAFGAEGITQ